MKDRVVALKPRQRLVVPKGVVHAALIALIPLVQGCGSMKGYEGASLPPEQLATLSDARGHKKNVYICQVDSKVVGSYYRGYPAFVSVTPGAHKIKLLYFDIDRDATGGTGAIVGGVLAGAVGGAIAGSISNESASRTFREIDFTAKAGVTYQVNLDSGTDNAADVGVWLENNKTGEVVARAKSLEAPRPTTETEVARSDWKNIPPYATIKVVAKNGGFVGKVLSYDGAYLWMTLESGRKKSFVTSEIDKISTLSYAVP